MRIFTKSARGGIDQHLSKKTLQQMESGSAIHKISMSKIFDRPKIHHSKNKKTFIGFEKFFSAFSTEIRNKSASVVYIITLA